MQLHRYGLLKPGTEGSVLLKSADGRQIATASFLIAPSKLRVQLKGVARSVPTEIRIERTPCPFGGTRPWLRCRVCNSRRSILYGLDEECKGVSQLPTGRREAAGRTGLFIDEAERPIEHTRDGAGVLA